MSTLIIKNGVVSDPANNIDDVMDIFIEDGIIKKVDKNITVAADETIDASGKAVMPGFIDLNVHLREPGYEKKETIATGSLAAAKGGYTTICAMPDTDPVCDNEIVVTYIGVKAQKESVVNVLPIGSVTKGHRGEELADIGRMSKAGACAISDAGYSVKNAGLMKTALKYSKMFGLPVFTHCEDKDLSGKGSVNAGDSASLLGLKGISNDSEEIMVARDTILAGSCGASLHLSTISAEGSVILIKHAKERGFKITCEVTPHHISLSDEDVPAYDANFKTNPPLRSKKDVEALKNALKDGVIDCIATNHSPVHVDQKNCEFEKAEYGVIGLETAFGVCYTELVKKNYLTKNKLIEKMSLNPAKILNIDKGTLSVGAVADITIADLDNEYTIEADDMVSKAKNTPFDGKKVYGRIDCTIVNGKVIYRRLL